jgi:hypothetical protein
MTSFNPPISSTNCLTNGLQMFDQWLANKSSNSSTELLYQKDQISHGHIHRIFTPKKKKQIQDLVSLLTEHVSPYFDKQYEPIFQQSTPTTRRK